MKQFFAVTIATFLLTALPRPISAAWPAVSGASAMPTFRELVTDERVTTLKAVLDDYGSPLAPEAKNFVFYADKYQLDWKLVPAIAGAESTFGKRIPTNSYNAWGWAVFTGKQSGVRFTSWEGGIAEVSRGLREEYLSDGLTTLEQIGRRYAASRAWPNSVRFFIQKIEGFAPASAKTLAIEL